MLFAFVVIAQVVAEPLLIPSSPAGVFSRGEVPGFKLTGFTGDIEKVEWTLFDWRRKALESGMCGRDKCIRFGGEISQGYYFVQAKVAGREIRDGSFCVVSDPSARQMSKDSFWGVDGAISSSLGSPRTFATDWHGGNPARALTDLLRLAGISHVRDRFIWKEVEPSSDKFNWGRFLDNARLAKERGINVCELLDHTPDHAERVGVLPGDLVRVFRSCRAMAKSFGGTVDAWECWNELDRKKNPVWDCMSVMKAAYLGFKAGNPDMAVLNASLTGDAAAGAFAALMFENDLIRYSDAYNMHLYLPPGGYERFFKDLYRFLERYDAADRPIWITESSANVEGEAECEGIMPAFRAHSYNQEMALAEFYQKGRILMQFHGVARDYAFVLPPYNEHDGLKDWGMQRRDGSMKPIYCAVSTATEYLADAVPLGEKKVADGIRAFIYGKPDGTQAVVYWSVSPCDGSRGFKGQMLKEQTKEISRMFSLKAVDGEYKVANWCGTARTAKAVNGALQLVSSRYPSFVTGMKGLSVDMPARACGKIKTYEPSSDEDVTIVLRVEFNEDEFRIGSGRTTAEMDGERGRIKIHIWNLSETAKCGSIRVQGVKLDGLPQVVELPPMGRRVIEATVLFPVEERKSKVDMVLDGVFDGKRISRLTASILSDKVLLETSEIVSISANSAEYWSRNDSATNTQITWDEKEQAVRFECEWKDPAVDRWLYPVHMFADRAESFDGASMVEFEMKIKQNTAENDTAAAVLMIIPGKSTPPGNRWLFFQGPNGEWEKRRVGLSGASGSCLADGAEGFRLGCNPRGSRTTLWIRNMRIIKNRNTISVQKKGVTK